MGWKENLARRITARAGYDLVARGRRPKPFTPDFSDRDRELIESVAPYTMTSPERIVALRHAVKYIVAARIPGDIVECGVWRGGSMMAAALTLIEAGDTSRGLYLFDTFEGMPPPTEADRTYDGECATRLMESEDRTSSGIWAVAGLESVQQAMMSVGYSGPIHYVRGKVEDTISREAPEQIALLRLDTDWYESTRHELIHLYPRLALGGILIIDDYGHWQGARRAVDEYLSDHGIAIMLSRTDFSGRIAIKNK